MTISRHYSTVYIENKPFSIKSGNIIRDEAFAPYLRGSIVIATPDAATLAILEPRTSTPPQLVIVAASSHDASPWGEPATAPLNGVEIPPTQLRAKVYLRSRTIDHEAGEVTITFGGAEQLLQDYRLHQSLPYSMESSSVITALSKVYDRVPVGKWTQEDIGQVAPGSTTLRRTNLCINPSFELTLTGWTANNADLARVQSIQGGVRGVYCARVTPNGTNTDTSLQLSATPAPGKTYTVSAWFTLTAALVGTLHARALKIVAFVRPDPASPYVEISSAQKANEVSRERLSVTFTVPPNVNDVIIRFYHGGAGGTNVKPLLVDGVLVEETSFLRSYFDGHSWEKSGGATYAWTGAEHASTSTAIEVASVGDIATVWQPGQTAWDFLEPLLAASRMRYYADEEGVWRKADADYRRPGSVRISAGWNATAANDEISRKADSDWCDAVMVKYTWTDPNGVTQIAYDRASMPGFRKVKLVEVASAYPGPGAAAYILNRAQGRGRVLTLGAVSDYSVKPGQEIVATLPLSPISTGYISAVDFNLGTDEMTITSRQLTDTPPNAWLLAPTGRSWESEPAGITWNTYTN